MKSVEIQDAIVGEEAIIKDLAWGTWWTAYRNIVSDEQIRYMLDTLYREEILRQQITNSEQQFIILREDGIPRGFAAYSARADDPSIFKLHKLYVLPDCQGKGFGRRLLEEITSRLRAKAIQKLDLNVNRQNPAFNFYRGLGFEVLRQEDVPIGPYWMNDYVMRLDIPSHPVA
ncbi:GNAT family N-acetyltransferase [Chryseolinea sp. T2]|uniref:GNAT family N-acetyltransferase n=1 Tax=Chryseolinea sp. T2 TaxID=3129255 RepID=UPI003076E732